MLSIQWLDCFTPEHSPVTIFPSIYVDAGDIDLSIWPGIDKAALYPGVKRCTRDGSALSVCTLTALPTLSLRRHT